MTTDSLEKAVGTGPMVTLGGREWKVRPLTVGDYLAFKSYIKSTRIRDFSAGAGKDMDSVDRVAVLTNITNTTIGAFELTQESESPEGLVYMLWRTMIKTDPAIKLEDVPDLLTEVERDELKALADSLTKADEGGDASPPAEGTDSDGTS